MIYDSLTYIRRIHIIFIGEKVSSTVIYSGLLVWPNVDIISGARVRTVLTNQMSVVFPNLLSFMFFFCSPIMFFIH